MRQGDRENETHRGETMRQAERRQRERELDIYIYIYIYIYICIYMYIYIYIYIKRERERERERERKSVPQAAQLWDQWLPEMQLAPAEVFYPSMRASADNGMELYNVYTPSSARRPPNSSPPTQQPAPYPTASRLPNKHARRLSAVRPPARPSPQSLLSDSDALVSRARQDASNYNGPRPTAGTAAR